MVETDAETQEVCLALRLLEGNGRLGLSQTLSFGEPLRRLLRTTVSGRKASGRPPAVLAEAAELDFFLSSGSTQVLFTPRDGALITLVAPAAAQVLDDCRRLADGQALAETRPDGYRGQLDDWLVALVALGSFEIGRTVSDQAPLAAGRARATLSGASIPIEPGHELTLRGYLRRGDLDTRAFGLRDDLGDVWQLALPATDNLLELAEEHFGRRVEVVGSLRGAVPPLRLTVSSLRAVPRGSGWGTTSRVIPGRRRAEDAVAHPPLDLSDEEVASFLKAVDD